MNSTTTDQGLLNATSETPLWNATAILELSMAPSVAPTEKPPTLETQLGVGTFVVLFLCVIVSTFLAGTTVQWTLNKGLLEKKLLSKANQYNVLVSIAGVSSMIHTLLCFFNNIMYPNLAFGVAMSVVVNWVVMTNSSIMLVSQRLALTFQNPKLAWRRLLWINYMALPLCITIGTSWAISHNTTPKFPALDQFVKIIEPVQIALFGVVEFVLSGAFIVQMWKYRWTDVERHGMFMLFAVGGLDMLSVLLNLMMGDLASTCVKGLVYSLRIRLEVNVLCCMVDYIKNRRGRVTYGSSGTTGADGATGRQSQRRASEFFRIQSHRRPSQKNHSKSSKASKNYDSEMERLREELNSGASEISGAGTSHEQAPHRHYRQKENSQGRSDIPIKIENNTNFTVSQLRSSTGTDSPHQLPEDYIELDHSGAQQEDSDGESFTNDFFRQHFLEAKRLEEEEALKKKLETQANTKANQRSVLNDTDSTTRMTNTQSAELSTSFHDDLQDNEDNPFHDLEKQARSTPSNINHSDKTLLMNNSSNKDRSDHNCSAPFSVAIDTSESDAIHINRSSHLQERNEQQNKRASLESVNESYELYPNDEPYDSDHDSQQHDCQNQPPYERRYSSSSASSHSHHEQERRYSSSTASSQRSYDRHSQEGDHHHHHNNHHHAGMHQEQDLESQSQSSDSSMVPQPRHSYQQQQQQNLYSPSDGAESAEFFDCVHSTSELDYAPYTYAPNTVVIDSSMPPQRITIKNKSNRSSSRRSIT